MSDKYATPVWPAIVLLAAGVLVSGCFNPSYPTGQACSETSQCPPGQFCVEGSCRLDTGPGLPDAGPKPIDAPPQPALDVKSVATGEVHSCAVVEGGEVVCWGEADDGRLGYGNLMDVGARPDYLPRHAGFVDVGGAVDKLALGARHTCALLLNGDVRCWGSNEVGQIGSGIAGEAVGDDETPAQRPPVDLGGLPAFDIAAFRNNTCALMDDRRSVYCWGEGGPQLGMGVVADAHVGDTETPFEAGALSMPDEILALDVGNYHVCALLSPGHVMCWGIGDHGRLGLASTADVSTVPGKRVKLGDNAVAVAVGGAHTCAHLTDGLLYCWGRGDNGRLGIGSVEHIGDEMSDMVSAVSLGAEFTRFAAGSSHTCAVLVTGELRCWGSAARGQLAQEQGAGDIGDDELPSAASNSSVVEVSRGERVVDVALGLHHGCVIIEGGPMGAKRRVRCFGAGDGGALGYGSTVDIGDNEVVTMSGDVPIF